MCKLNRFLPLAGRILISQIFLMSGFHKIFAWEQTAGYMASKGMPMIPLFLLGAIVFELAGGLAVLTGFMARTGALLLIIFMIPTTLIFHNFWALEGMDQQIQMIMFMKNLAIMGGLFFVLSFGAGPLAVGCCCKKRTTDPKRPGKKEFSERYSTGDIPWDIGKPQSDFVSLFETGAITGSVLDVGCGTGENALFLAERGLDVTGIDFVPQAIEKARAKSEKRGLKVRFEEGDALNMQLGGKKFDTVIDSGVFHVFSDADRPKYVANIASAIKPGGRLHILCWSNLEPGDEGPRRVSPEELREAFSSGWEIRGISRTHFEANLENRMPQALLMTAIRTNRDDDDGA